MNRGVVYGIGSALLFGASTPLAKSLLGTVAPLWLAALLYLGAGAGLLIVVGVRRWFSAKPLALPAAGDWRWIGAATGLGGIVGPVALMYGLARTTAASASLLLNLEGVATACLAWFLFRENFDRRIAVGMLAIVLGAALLTITPGPATASAGGALVVVACLCWALDNNLTRKASASDPALLASIKGLVAGVVNASAALVLGMAVPPPASAAGAAIVGFAGYGVSLVLFVLALRDLGTARTGAYFSVAPFFGAIVAVVAGNDSVTWPLLAAAVLMGIGVWLHVSEHHAHEHTHEPIEHSHSHTHDEHHRHEHAFEWHGEEPHVHRHVHAALTHSHPHYPDVHHRHRH